MQKTMENLTVLLKRGLNHDDDGLQFLYPLQKKRQRTIGIDPSISGLVTSLLQNRRPSKLRILSFKEAVANVPKPVSKPNPKAKTTTHSQVFEKRSLPLPLGKAPVLPRRTTKASASVKTKTKPSFQKQSPQFPEIISLDLDEAVAVPLPKLPKPPQSPTTTPVPVSEEKNLSSPIPEVSPRRTLRAAELKTRFATTIFKAQHHTLFDSAPADVATRKAEAAAALELRRVQEKQREAARIALLKVEEAADGRDNMQIFKELQELSGSALDYPNGLYALDRFGLILKR